MQASISLGTHAMKFRCYTTDLTNRVLLLEFQYLEASKFSSNQSCEFESYFGLVPF
jgi:hypothetical protein